MILARIICLLPGLMLLPSGIGWMINPAETSISFGFIFEDLSSAAQNALIRCLLYTSPSPRDATLSRMPSSA